MSATVPSPIPGIRVRVTDFRSEELAGVPSGDYESPPHPTACQALELVRVLLGSDPDPDAVCWERPIAGGHRRVELLGEVTR